MPLNPFAAEFVPIDSNIDSKKNKNNKNKTKMLDTLNTLSTHVAEKVLQPFSHLQFEKFLNPVHKELLTKQVEDSIKEIPKITNVDGLEQVAQISYYHRTSIDVFELFWDGTHAILDNSRCTWQFPNMTIRDIIQCYFCNVTISQESPELDEPASYAPAIQLVVTPL